MARVTLDIRDPAVRLTLDALLRAAGHSVSDSNPEVIIADTPERALRAVPTAAALVLTAAPGIANAVAAMRQGVFGYIFLPLQPEEAPLMVARASAAGPAHSPVQETDSLTAPLHQAEREHILRVLRHCRGNQARAARLLGIGRNTLWRKLRAYNEDGRGND